MLRFHKKQISIIIKKRSLTNTDNNYMTQKIDIKTAAEGIGYCLFIGANKDAELILDEAKKLDGVKFGETTLGHVADELSHFYLHLTDRFAFAYLKEKRAELVDESVFCVYKSYIECHKAAGGKVDDDTFLRIFNDKHIERQKEYGKYKEQKELLRGFEDRISEILGVKNDEWVSAAIHSILVPCVGRYHEVCEKFIKQIG